MSARTGDSVWWCALYQLGGWLAHQPKRQRCRLCQKWMMRTL